MHCIVFGCKNNNKKKSKKKTQSNEKPHKKLHFHSFPRDQLLCDKWISLCRRPNPFNPKTAHICSDHFRKEDYKCHEYLKLYGIPKSVQLKPGSVPAKNLYKSSSNDKDNLENQGQSDTDSESET